MSSISHPTRRFHRRLVCLGAFVLTAAFVLIGCEGREEAYKLYQEGHRFLYVQDDRDRAIHFFLKALESDPTLSQAHMGLANAYWRKGLLEKRKHHLREAIRVAPNHIEAHYQLGVIAYKDGAFDLALREFETTHRLLKVPFGWEPGKRSYKLFMYEGFLLLGRGDVLRAEAILGQAQALRPTDYHRTLAGLYRAQGKYAEAKPLYKRALAIREKVLGPDHPDVAEALYELARFYRAQGKYAEAEPLYKRALAIREKALGPDHPHHYLIVTTLEELGHLYEKMGREDEAEPLYKRALAIREKALGPDHPDVTTALYDLARFYRDQGKNAEAEPLYKRALAIREKAL
ncbi:tetratricopeptide repeat protein, partial [Nitrospinae bacterium AH_259_B05_G02_I21]|nr:tetratricopeptide repeat protein [Nitrospinae bacterium AH_259_B05_G02_I21]